MIDGLINIEEKRYKNLLFLFFKRIHNYKINTSIAPFLPTQHSVFVLIKYDQPINFEGRLEPSQFVQTT